MVAKNYLKFVYIFYKYHLLRKYEEYEQILVNMGLPFMELDYPLWKTEYIHIDNTRINLMELYDPLCDESIYVRKM